MDHQHRRTRWNLLQLRFMFPKTNLIQRTIGCGAVERESRENCFTKRDYQSPAMLIEILGQENESLFLCEGVRTTEMRELSN